jgi:hypothetical protein
MGGAKGASSWNKGKSSSKGKISGKGKAGGVGADWWSGKGFDQWADGAAWGQQQAAWDGSGSWAPGAGEEWADATTGGGTFNQRRIINKNQLAPSLLRGACATDGTAFSRAPQWKRKNDQQMLEPAAMRAHMSWDSAHLCRRPGVGLSEAAGSMEVLAELLEQKPDFDDLKILLEDADVKSALAEINLEKDRDRDRPVDDLAESLQALLRKLKTDSDARAAAVSAAIYGSRLYVGAMQFLQAASMASAPSEWVEWIHAELPGAGSKAVKKWIAKPKDKHLMGVALATLMKEARAKAEEWEAGSKNKASDLFGSKRKAPATADANDESDSEGAPRHKKGKGKGTRAADSENADTDESQ